MALFPLQRAALVVSGTAVALGAVTLPPATVVPARAGSLFQIAELNEQNFVLVSAPIGDGSRAQLNIYEQLNNRRPCYETVGSQPAQVNPLLTTFDFTGICGRFLDANGYSLRVGGTDLAPTYRLSVIRRSDDNVLLAVPTTPGAGPEMVVARSQGAGDGFLQLLLEPGWQLKRRAYNGRNLGHVYLYRADWPGGGEAVASPALPSPPALPANGLPVQPFASGS
ncbi:MAG: DUF3747 domain-containing protein [Cyanobium sp. M30B3]|jgi:hypothetical protein|nr:MAG: DUF3747 domain-containing protein [Cyanobium sp. M30B3]